MGTESHNRFVDTVPNTKECFFELEEKVVFSVVLGLFVRLF